MRGSGYGSYRGKSKIQTFLKVLIVLLLLVLVLAVAAFFLLEKYMVYSADGARLQLPWWGGGQTEPMPVDTATPEPTLVIDTPEPTPTPPAQRPLQAVLLPRSALIDGTAATQVDAAGGNAALFDMKAPDGSLGYVSNLALAIEARTSAADPALNAAIRGLTGGELYTVARVSCFRDNTMPRHRNSMAIRSNAGNWLDEGGNRWLSPTNVDARRYVADICMELAELGFDEILLDNSAYPTGSKISQIRAGADYDRARLSTQVADFYGEVRQALADYPEVKLSIVGSETAVALGADPDSGQSAALLAEQADHIWLPSPSGAGIDYAQALTQAGVEDSAAKIVLFDQRAGRLEENWAIWSLQTPGGQT